VYKEVIRFNFAAVVLLVVCLLAGCAGAFFLGAAYSKSQNLEHSGRDNEYRGQMGRASELLESVDERLTNVQDGFGRIKSYLGENAGELRGLAQRLRIIASEVAEIENDLNSARNDIDYFRRHNNISSCLELR